MGLFDFFTREKKIAGPPMTPNPELTEAEKLEIAELLDGEEQLIATLQKLKEKSDRLRAETSRSIRGIK